MGNPSGWSNRLSSEAATSEGTRRTQFGTLRVRATREQSWRPVSPSWQLTADATHSYQYDDNGNLIRKTLLATGNYTQYTYDAENRLIKVEEFVAGNPTAAFTSTYRYDGLGRRIEKVANGQTKRYIYDGEDILLEYDSVNVLQARYTHGPGIDEPIAVTKGGSTFFYHQDGLGSVTDLTDSAGVTAKSYSYDAYGNILESPGTVEQPYTYTGREFDAESGLYYYRARSYDAVAGRFIQRDPIGIEEGRNLYLYVRGNPLNKIDPRGLEDSSSGIFPKLSGEILGSIVEGVIVDGIGGQAGLVCASRFCKRQKANPAWHTVFTECTSIFYQYRIPAGTAGDTAAIVESCTKTCQEITKSAQFKKDCNCRKEE